MLRAASEANQAQLELWVFDARAPPEASSDLDAAAAVAMIEGSDEALGDGGSGGSRADGAASVAEGGGADRLLVLNKVDLIERGPEGVSAPPTAAVLASGLVPPERLFALSCATGEGVPGFLAALGKLVQVPQRP